jgi:hypothetical protein
VRAVLLAVLALALWPAAATAQDAVAAAARTLRADRVYVDPSAELAGQVDAGELRRRIGDHAIWIAVLPSDAGDPVTVARELRTEVGRSGAYAVIVGTHFRAGPGTDVAQAADAAIRAHRGDPQATLDDFVDRVEGKSPDPGSGGIGAGAVVLLVLVAGAGALLLTSRRRRRRREADELAEVRETARDDLVALGDDVRALDLDVQMPGSDPAAREDYARAVEAYDRANRVFETARRPEDLAPASAALEEGRWAMSSARARLEGRPPPERRPPCFFDPRHGPSSRDVEWAPPGGTPRPVPACEADAQRVERGEEPRTRQVGGVPYWDAGPAYAPFYGGFFGGGFLPGLLVGEMLGGWGSPTYIDTGDTGGDGGGDDWGGGDFGGGGDDFGGGDFGGGDFGGGDF